jgi:hypothetical protein
MTDWIQEEAEAWAVHKSKDPYQCPACTEGTLWHMARDAYAAGIRRGLERAAQVAAELFNGFHSPYDVERRIRALLGGEERG